MNKSDLIDAELEGLLKEDIPRGIEYVFISAITGKGIMELKDLIWNTLNDSLV